VLNFSQDNKCLGHKKMHKPTPKKKKKPNNHNIINYLIKPVVGHNTNVATHQVVE
jgi:hypothetical protein